MNAINMRLGLATSAIALSLGGCSFMSELPGAGIVSSGYKSVTSIIPGMGPKADAPKGTVRPAVASATAAPAMPRVPPSSGDSPLAVAGAQAGVIVDAVSRCATSNPFANEDETIRWYGACRDGKLEGKGTLIWYVKNVETERNVGVFRGGEFDGEVVTTYPDGQVVVGTYRNGTRDGEFTVVKADGGHVRANYSAGTLMAQRDMSMGEVDGWRRQRATSGGALLAQAAATPPQATATTSAANQRLVSGATATASGIDRVSAATPSAPVEPVLQPASMSGMAPVQLPAPRPAPATTVAMMAPSQPAMTQTLSAPVVPAAMTVPAVRPMPTAEPAVLRAPRGPGQMASLADQYAGRDGPWVVSSGSAAPAAQPIAMTASTSSSAPVLRPPASAASSRNAPVSVAPARNAPASRNAALVLRPPAGGDVRDLAADYAGQDGPWVITASAASAQQAQVLRAPSSVPAYVAPAPVYVAPAPAFVAPVQPVTQMAAAPVVAVPQVQGAAVADTLFAQGYQLEMAGRFFEAEKAYESVLVTYPSAPSAVLANTRLNALRQVSRGGATIVAAPAGYAPASADAPVVSVNNPMPATSAALQAGRGSSNNPTLALQSDLINREVCTQEGIYGNAARWCGLVRFDEGDFLRVEIRDVTLPSFGQIGITRSACTGNTLVTWFSRGTSLRVPKRCMTVVG